MAADCVRASVRGASGDLPPEWWEAIRQLEEKMLDCMRLQKEMQAALNQKLQEANRNVEEAEKRMEKLKSLEEEVEDLKVRCPPSWERSSTGDPVGEGTVHQAPTPKKPRVQRMHESVRQSGRIFETLLVSPVGPEEPTEIVQQLSAQQEESVPQTLVAVERREVEHLETHMSEDPVQQAPESTSHRGSASGFAEQWPVLAGEVDAVNTQVLIAQQKTAQDALKIMRSTGGTLESSLENVPVTDRNGEVDDGEAGARGSALESSLEKTHVADAQDEAEHPETDKTLQEEPMRQTVENTSHQRSVLEPVMQTPVLALRQEEVRLAEGSAQAGPDSAGPSGGLLEPHQNRWRPEVPPARRTSRTSSSPSVSKEQDASLGVSHTGPHLKALGDLLIKATRKGREGEVRNLLLAGAEVNFADENGETPLLLAAMSGGWSTVVPLLYSGANVNAVTKNGFTPLHFAAAFDTTGQWVTMLLNAGANRESKEELGRTPLHLAAFYDNKRAAFELEEAGASKTSTDNDGRTPYNYTRSDLLRHFLRP